MLETLARSSGSGPENISAHRKWVRKTTVHESCRCAAILAAPVEWLEVLAAVVPFPALCRVDGLVIPQG